MNTQRSKKNRAKIIAAGLKLFFALILILATSCNSSSVDKQELKKTFDKYVEWNVSYPDSVIYFRFSNDSLFLTFPNTPKHKQIQIDMVPDISRVYKIVDNRILIVDDYFTQFNDSSQFVFIALPQDGYLYIPNTGSMVLRFPYVTTQPGKMTLTRKFEMFRVNNSFYSEIKDRKLMEALIDSINSHLTYEDRFLPLDSVKFRRN